MELDAETDVMHTSIYDLAKNDTFVEYINNIENSLFMGLTRYASSNLLPVKIYAFDEGVYSADLVESKELPKLESDGTFKTNVRGEIEYKTVTKPLAHKIKEVFAENSNGDIISNIEYFVIGNNVRIRKPKQDYKYFVIYYPMIHDFDFYLENSDDNIYDIELDELGITDEMAINLKYFVFSDLKLEENPNVANINKNYFETYLSDLQRTQVSFNQTELVNRANVDVYSDDAVAYDRDWRDVYGD
jgi:hypothetical protein